jgi:DNA-directed RNA polymerase subunit RPC12/RpoP
MNKEQLMKLRRLDATPKMMKMAAADKPEKYPIWKGTEDRYKTRLYMRCQTLGGILKVAFFLPHIMRARGRRASFELFINRETGDFLTYDVNAEKWREAKVDMLPWPSYSYGSGNHVWINPEGYRSIKQYLGTEHGGYRGILDYQLSVREKQLKQRYKKETGPWDADMEQIPELPKDWQRWVCKVGIDEHFIYYPGAGAKTGWCSWCENEVPVSGPRHNKPARCPRCGHSVTLKSEAKAGTVITKNVPVYLLQRCDSNFVIREFDTYLKYRAGKYRQPETSCFERRRVIYDKHFSGRAYYWGDYKQHETRWISTSPSSNYYRADGAVYGKTIPLLSKNELARTGLPEIIRSLKKTDPEWYIEIWRRKPWLEQLAKAGLCRLAMEHADARGYNVSSKDWRTGRMEMNGELHKRLGINKKQFRRLRENNGGLLFAEWIETENRTGRELQDRIISWFEREDIHPKELDFIRDRMSEVQICNYLKRQNAETGEKVKQILRTWEDYLKMAKRLKMDTSDAIIYRCRKLRQRHDELVKRFQSKELAMQAAEYAVKYPNVDEICKSLKKKYEFANDKYIVLAPSGIEDIIAEGEALSHCGGKSDRYFERIEVNESYVLFLRKASEPDKPYYTLDIEPCGTVRQKRTYYDRQNPDIKDAENFLKAWQKEITKRMTEEDIALAEQSRNLRIQNFEELKVSKKIVTSGHLAGKLLGEVLQADLMENEIPVIKKLYKEATSA